MNYFPRAINEICLTLFLALGLTIFSCNVIANEKYNQPFSKFWKEFRTATLNNNIIGVMNMTKFPFTVKGELDMDGSTTLDKLEFEKRFMSFMEQNIGENLKPESMRTYIKNNELITPKIDDGQTSVALFSFEIFNGKWYYINVYIQL